MNKFRVRKPSNFILIGGTGSGKTTLMLQIIERRRTLFEKEIDSIVYCYEIYQDIFNHYPYIKFVKGSIKNIEEMFSNLNPNRQRILVLDDMQTLVDDAQQGLEMSKIFAIYGHHLGINVFLLSQNLFYQNKYFRSITLNSHYIILFNMRRDKSQLKRFFGQIYPSRAGVLMDIYNKAVNGVFEYLVVDMAPDNKSSFLLRTNILPGEIERIYKPVS